MFIVQSGEGWVGNYKTRALARKGLIKEIEITYDLDKGAKSIKEVKEKLKKEGFEVFNTKGVEFSNNRYDYKYYIIEEK